MTYPFQSIYFDNPIVPGRCLDIFLPDHIGHECALFFVHGGGWHSGSRDGQHALMRAFNAEGFICASTDYRLSGVTVLDQLTDVRHGYDLFVSCLKNQQRPLRIVMSGGSAGGHLAALLTLAKPGACGETLDYNAYCRQNEWIPPVAGVFSGIPITMEPWEDMFPMPSIDRIVGVSYEQNPELYRKVSPIQYVSPDSQPILFMEGANEHVFPLKFVQEFVGKMKANGRRATYKVYPNAEHGFFYDITRRCQVEAFADFRAFIESLEEGD